MEGQFSDAEEEVGIKRKLSGSCQKTLERKALDGPSPSKQHNTGNMDSHTDDELQYFSDESDDFYDEEESCLLYTSPSPRDGLLSRMPSSA